MKPTDLHPDSPVTSPASTPAQDETTPFVAAKMPSHTQLHPVAAPHTLEKRSVLKAPDQFTRIFLLAWAVRYIPRGLLGEVFSKNAFPAVKRAVNTRIDKAVLNRMEGKINTVLAENSSLVKDIQTGAVKWHVSESDGLFKKLKKEISGWRPDDASREIEHIVQRAEVKNGTLVMSESSKDSLRNVVRGKMDDIGYSLALFAGSSALSYRYSRLVRHDIQNLFKEAVAYEKDVPEKNISFKDIAQSDNKIVRGTMKKYHKKLAARLGSDSLFLLATPFKSTHLTDFLLGIKGAQMLSETWNRKETMFEDFITFVNNKINPYNGLGQPVSIGEVFDLYQHYAQAYNPSAAFTGVIEHGMDEGIRWAGNQQIFQRMTDLLNKTYAYKHQSIVNPATGHTVMQADFALPKFIYLLGHDLIDVNDPKKTLTAIELANAYGIPSVKEMGRMLKSGKSVDDVIKRFNITLPKSNAQAPVPEEVNGVLPKDPTVQFDTAPANTVDANSIMHAAEINSLTKGISAI